MIIARKTADFNFIRKGSEVRIWTVDGEVYQGVFVGHELGGVAIRETCGERVFKFPLNIIDRFDERIGEN